MPWFVFRNFIWDWRTGADNGHFAFENVDELRQFVEAELAEYVTERINARIVFHLESLSAGFVLGHEFFFAFFGIDIHTAELVHRKECTVLAYAGLLKDDWALRVANLDSESAEQKEWREKNECKRCARNIDSPFDDVPNADFVWVNPNVREVQAVQREETSVRTVEFLQLVVQFDVFFFLIAGVEVGLENRSIRLVAECLD